jgi:hypothetical protein
MPALKLLIWLSVGINVKLRTCGPTSNGKVMGNKEIHSVMRNMAKYEKKWKVESECGPADLRRWRPKKELRDGK